MLKKVYKNSKYSSRMLKDLVVDKEGVVRGSEGEKNICNSICYGTE